MTHNERVLALLSDCQPHSHRELYGLYVMGHSRVADLRKQGHVIECWREGDLYFYRLEVSGSDPQTSRPTGPPSPAGLDADPSAFSEPDQLTLAGVAA